MQDERIDAQDAAPAASAPAARPAAERQVTMWNRKAVMMLACILAITVMVVGFMFNAPRPQSAASAGEHRHPPASLQYPKNATC